jgi:hypothetical protein
MSRSNPMHHDTHKCMRCKSRLHVYESIRPTEEEVSRGLIGPLSPCCRVDLELLWLPERGEVK